MREFGRVMAQSQEVMLISGRMAHHITLKKRPAINLQGVQFPDHAVS